MRAITTKLSSKGQIVIPQEIRESHLWKAGTEIIVEDRPDGVLLRSVKPFPPKTIDEVMGCLKYKGKPVPLKDIVDTRQSIAEMVKRRSESGRY